MSWRIGITSRAKVTDPPSCAAAEPTDNTKIASIHPATILIVFELTRSYDLTIAAMVAVVFANLISYRLFGRSLFDVQLRNRGFDLTFGRGSAILAERRVSELVHDDYLTFKPGDTLKTAQGRIAGAGRSEGLVIAPDGSYLGIIRLEACIGPKSSGRVADVMDAGALKFDDDTSIWQAMEAFRAFYGEIAPVVSSQDGRLLGVVSESAVIDAYLSTVDRLRREENESV